MQSKVFDTPKGQHPWPENTICEVHRRLYDLLVFGRHEDMLPLLEEAYLLGIKMTKKLVENKLALPEWQKIDDPEVRRLRELRVQLTEKLNEAGANL